MRELLWTLYLNHLARKRARLEAKVAATNQRIEAAVARYRRPR